MYTRGPIAALMPTSPGTLFSVPVTTNFATPSDSVSPICRVERDEQRRIDDDVVSVLQLRPRRGRRRDDLSVERIRRRDGVHLHESRAAGPRHERHRREVRRRRRRDAAAATANRAANRSPWSAAPGASTCTSPPSSALRLFVHRPNDVLGERVDRHERRDAERDRRHVEQQAPARGAALAPRERRRAAECRPSGGPLGLRIGNDAAVAQANDALARGRRASRSCVTRTIVVFDSRLSASSSSTMRAPVSLSRFPVGSSAKRMRGALANARAMATRCCSPPESWVGK